MLAPPITLWHFAPALQASRRSSVVERAIGNGEVGSSILPDGTISPHYAERNKRPFRWNPGGYIRPLNFAILAQRLHP